MLTLAPFTFCANNVPGTDPIRAMDMARRCGFHTIELSAIDGISEQIVAERVSTGYVAQIERELQKRDLQCTALSAHCDMTDEAQFARLMKNRICRADRRAARQYALRPEGTVRRV